MSPLPLLTSLVMLLLTSSAVYWFKFKSSMLMILSLSLLMFMMWMWWRDCSRESTFQGNHNFFVQKGLKFGMLLFIFSEVLFFFAFFWTFMHVSVSVCTELGMVWPPILLSTMSPFQVPILNTLVLLSSGVTVTLAHYSKINNLSIVNPMIWTITLGVYFTALQLIEYINASFSFSDSKMGSIFFLATGFHGAHVLIGTTFLLIQTTRMVYNNLSMLHHLGFELSIWYWHFVDVVWLFLFTLVYWWGW